MSWDDVYVRGVSAWNVTVLPALLAVWVVFETWRGGADRSAAVRRLGAAHLALAAWSVVRVAEELLAYRVMGVFPSNPVTGLPGSVLAMLCDLPVGLGLVRLRPWSRRPALLLAAWRTLLAAGVTAWSWSYAAPYDPTEWPRTAAAQAFPPFALALLSLPGTRRVLTAGATADRPSPRLDAALAAAALAFAAAAASAAGADALGLVVSAVLGG